MWVKLIVHLIIWAQDVIYNIKIGFDEEFEALHRHKLQEILNVRERNKDIQRIMVKLDMKKELWEPGLTDSEQPEKLFTVDDSEVTDPPLQIWNKQKKCWQIAQKVGQRPAKLWGKHGKVLFQKPKAVLCTFVWLQIKAEKYLTPEQKQEEERKKLEEQQRLAARVCRHSKCLFTSNLLIFKNLAKSTCYI